MLAEYRQPPLGRRIDAGIEGCVVAIGNFDGVHLGHQSLLDEVKRAARALGMPRACAAALTFDPHPASYFRPEAQPLRLTTDAHKAQLLEQYGIEALVVLRFDAQLAGLSPEGFVDQVLVQMLGARHVVVGVDFRFGHKRAGDVSVLSSLCQERGIGLSALEALELGGAPVSSTRVRALVRDGDMEGARALLGRCFEVRGEVVHGDARGRTMGYPTANVSLEAELFIPDGIYATRMRVLESGSPWRAACSYIGKRPTFGPGPRTFETFVLDVAQGERLDLYESKVEVEFLSRIRPDHAFEDAQALVEQMDKDVARARELIMARGLEP